MILVDTSVWIDHLRSGNPMLTRLLSSGAVLNHPWITGELALGELSHRDEIIGLLLALPQATLASESEVLALIQNCALQGTGIGYVDAELLAATKLTPNATMWTRDSRLAAVAERLGMEFQQYRTG